MLLNTIDYSAFDEVVTEENLSTYKNRYPNAHKHTVLLISGGVALLSAVWTVAAIVSGIENKSEIYASIVLGIIFIGVGTIVTILNRKNTIKSAMLYKFAQRNGMDLSFRKPSPGYQGIIFEAGYNDKFYVSLMLEDGLEIGNYSYDSGFGKNRATKYWGYARIPLTRRLPHMVLDAKHNNLLKVFTNLPGSLDSSQVLLLEGNFNDFFTLYAPKQYERDALYVFTPDVMAAMIDFGAELDIEIIDDQLMLYSSDFIRFDSADYLYKLFSIIDILSSELRDQTPRYTDYRVEDKTANTIAEPGRRLKSKAIVSLLLFIILLLVWIWYLLQVNR